MRAGLLRHPVTIQNVGDGRDASGGVVAVMTDLLVWHAAIRMLAGQELFVAQQYFGKVTHEFSGRFVAGVTDKMQLKYGTRIFDIQSINNVDEMNRELRILAFERFV